MHEIKNYHWLQCLILFAIIDSHRVRQTRKYALIIIETWKFNLAILILKFFDFLFWLIVSTIARMQKNLHLIIFVNFKIHIIACNILIIIKIFNHENRRFSLCEVVTTRCLYKSWLLFCISKFQKTFSTKFQSRLQKLDIACNFRDNFSITNSKFQNDRVFNWQCFNILFFRWNCISMSIFCMQNNKNCVEQT